VNGDGCSKAKNIKSEEGLEKGSEHEDDRTRSVRVPALSQHETAAQGLPRVQLLRRAQDHRRLTRRQRAFDLFKEK
jgi:hypothetical protein